MRDPTLHCARSLAAILTNTPEHCADAIVLRSSSFQLASWEKECCRRAGLFFFLGQYFTVIKSHCGFCQAGESGAQGNKSLQKPDEEEEVNRTV